MIARWHRSEWRARYLCIRLYTILVVNTGDLLHGAIHDRPTCHFKHDGLKLGLPFPASSSVVNIYSIFFFLLAGCRSGSSFSAYVIKGNLSKIRFSGTGIANKLRFCAGARL